MAQTTAVVGAIGTAIATTTAPVVAKSPLAQAFDEMTVIAAIMGLFGGLTMAISNREKRGVKCFVAAFSACS